MNVYIKRTRPMFMVVASRTIKRVGPGTNGRPMSTAGVFIRASEAVGDFPNLGLSRPQFWIWMWKQTMAHGGHSICHVFEH